jgi:xanthine dehydrogenase accessory factor
VQSQDLEVFDHLLTWLAEGQRPWLCTIVAATGSSPRPLGAMLALTAEGRRAGSVSGGCVEDDLIAQLQRGDHAGHTPLILEYGLSAEQNERLGLPCGGRLRLLLQQLEGADRDWLLAISKRLTSRQCIERQVDLGSGATTLTAIERHQPLQLHRDRLQQSFGPRLRLLLVGAGQLAQSLAELAVAMDYEVLVTDPRQALLEQWQGPDVALLQGMPDDVLQEHAADRHSAIITLTHDPRIDDMALMEALASEAFYVGALGSVRTTEKRLTRLRQLGLSDQQLERLQAPVGLDIGSKTPLEIAVAIMAQLTRLQRRGH